MLTLFRRKAVPAPAPAKLPITLADQAQSALGLFDAMKAKSIADIRALRAGLAANVERDTAMIAACDETLAAEQAAIDHFNAQRIEAASADIEAAMEEIGLEVPVLDFTAEAEQLEAAE